MSTIIEPATEPQESVSDALIASVHEALTQAALALAATAQAHEALADTLRAVQEQVPARRRAPLARLWKRS
jgi:hypothetical protein